MSLWTSELLTGQPSSVGLLRHFVDGAFVESPSTFAKISPVTGEQIFDVCEADSETVDAAVNAARAALRGPWGRMIEQRTGGGAAPGRGRVGAALRRSGRGRGRRHRQADQPGADARHPARRGQLPGLRRHSRPGGDRSFPTDCRTGGQALNYAVRKPLGVVAVIVPWNLPLLLLTWKVAPALACGNAVVVKPSEETPASATLLAEVMAEAGVPRRRLQPGARLRPDVGGRVPDRASRRRRDHVHRRVRDRHGDHAQGRRRRVQAGVVRARRQERRAGVRRRRPGRGGRRARCGRSSPTPGRSACAPSGCTSQRPIFDEFVAPARRARPRR